MMAVTLLCLAVRFGRARVSVDVLRNELLLALQALVPVKYLRDGVVILAFRLLEVIKAEHTHTHTLTLSLSLSQ